MFTKLNLPTSSLSKPIEFRASDDWLATWKKTYGIKKVNEKGEAASADMEAAQKIKLSMPELLSHFSLEDI